MEIKEKVLKSKVTAQMCSCGWEKRKPPFEKKCPKCGLPFE